MKVGAKYSHLNGLEYLLVHHPELWEEVQDVIAEVNADNYLTKISAEKTMKGKKLFSPGDMNEAFKKGFENRGWEGKNSTFWLTADEKLMRSIYGLGEKEQKLAIEQAGQKPIRSHYQTDFMKQKVAVEVQLGKYAFVAHDLFVKYPSFYASGIIDVGIEILPMKKLEREMSTGVPYYERDLQNIMRQGRSVPAVPLVLIGIEP